VEEYRPWRYHPGKGFRKKGKPYHHDIETGEIDEEWFKSRDEFLEAIDEKNRYILEREDEGGDDE
jgi:hypothetical protein